MLADSILDGLNPEQRLAVETTEGPLLVLAGAGSGKTRVLVHRIAYLIGVCGIPPEAILAVTFTNKAAGEMRDRVEKLLGPDAGGLWVTTFHSACVRILRRDIGHLGYQQGFAIYDQEDSLGLVKDVLRRHSLDPKVNDPRRLRWRIDQWKNAGVLPARAAEQAQDLDEELSAELYTTYQRLLAEANALDFGDLLLQTVQLFKRFPDVLGHYRRRWQYVLVDEYQDTNRVQYDLVRQLVDERHNVCVVGDPNQSIYAWRGANIRNILDFEQDHPDAKIVKLERNYRSTQAILDGATGVVQNNRARRDIQLFTDREGGDPIRIYEAMDDRDEASFVVRGLLGERSRGRSLGQCAVFYRTNAQSRAFEDELLRYDVPYVIVGGVRFYERAEVKDALAYLRVLLNEADAVGLRRIVNKPTRGIGPATVEKAARFSEANRTSLMEGLRAVARGEGGRANAKVAAFLELMETLRADIDAAAPADALATILDRSGIVRALEREATLEAESRLENLRELVSAAEDFTAESAGEGETRSAAELFLDQVALVSDIDGYENRSDCISLMTAHMAKGLEFPVVYLVGMEEGVFPHSASSRDEGGIEEERRLCYVGMTRAMERLTLTYAQERRRYGSRSFAAPSRFLREIPTEVLSSEDADRVAARADQGDRQLDRSYAQDDPETGASIEPGFRVRHPIFGPGTVLAVSGAGPDQKLRIRFQRVGTKTVLLRYANLEPDL